MSMWDYDEQGDPYPPEERRQYHDPYASHSESGSSDYHRGYGGHQSHTHHNHHHHVHDHDHNQHHHHNDSRSYHGQRSGAASPSRPNYGSRHESYGDHGSHQSYRYNTTPHESYGSHTPRQESYETQTYASNMMSRVPAVQSANYGSSNEAISGYDAGAGYEVQQEYHAPPPPSTGSHGQEVSSRDLFTSDSVVNLTLDEIDALARTHRSRSWLVVLYAPWCRFCQAMEPNFERVANHLERSNVYVGRFRADGDYKEYAKRYLQLEHFPTILFFPKDSSHIVKYQSENREVDALLGFVHAFE